MATIGSTPRPAYVYDQETDTWVPVGVGPHTHSTFIENTIIDAAGDLIVGSAPDTVARLAIGGNGTYLKINTSLPNKLEWATVDALPSQTGNTGKYLTTNGTTASWSTIVTDPTPTVFMLMGA